MWNHIEKICHHLIPSVKHLIKTKPTMIITIVKTQKLHWDLEIQADLFISTRGPNLIIINKKKKERTYRTVDFVVPADLRVKLKESEKRDKYLDLAMELKKYVEHERDNYTTCNWCSWYSHQMISTRTAVFGNNRTVGDCLNYSIIEISQNTEKSPGDFKRLAVTQPSEKSHQLKQLYGHFKRLINNNSTKKPRRRKEKETLREKPNLS